MTFFPMLGNQKQTARASDFSIDHILNRAGNNSKRIHEDSEGPFRLADNFKWLRCSRYCPPKIPRQHKKEGLQKRQLGRHPRIPFTSHQLSVLEQKFKETPYLSSEEVIVLSKKLQLADIRVKIWFQNRRARERKERNVILDKTGDKGAEDIRRECKEETVESQKRHMIGHFAQEVNATPSDVFYHNRLIIERTILPVRPTHLPAGYSETSSDSKQNIPRPFTLSSSLISQSNVFFSPIVDFTKISDNKDV